VTGFCVVKPIRLDASAALSVAVASRSPGKQENPEAKSMSPSYINPVQWQQATGYARQVCARIFRDGGTPAEAIRAFGLNAVDPAANWSIAVDRIAQSLCASTVRKAA
jgi:hypothetical protein